MASTVGGAVGGVTGYLLEAFSLVLVLGITLGVAQAFVVGRYLRRGTAPLWALASSFGWFSGWLALGLAVLFLRISVPGLDLQAGSATFGGVQVPGVAFLVTPAVCAVFGAFQAAVLVYVHGRPFLPLAALWVAASAAGGALAPVGGLAVAVVGAGTSAGGGGGFVNLVLGPTVGTAAASTLYGIVTGVAFAMLIRRPEAQEGLD